MTGASTPRGPEVPRPGGRGSQFQQDVYLSRNIFARGIVDGKKGFYVDSGANDATYFSNSLFFDRCLGWEGLCVEPNHEYHQGLKTQRSCTLVPECIADVAKTMEFSHEAAGSHVSEVAGANGQQVNVKRVQCRPLDQMLQMYGGGRDHVDFWSLDIEGFEMTVLRVIPWSRITFGAILIEDFWLSNRVLDYFMGGHGYSKFQQLAIDSLYMPWDRTVEKRWLPDGWDSIWGENQVYREAVRAKGLLAKDF